MKQTTEKIRALHIQMVSTIYSIRDEMKSNNMVEPARALYDAYATISEAAADLDVVLGRLDGLQKGVDSSV